MKKILIVEPYMGGSHQHFIEGLSENVDASFTFITLPARSWKSRMQLSAVWCFEELKKLDADSRQFDIVFCSTFVDLSVLRSLLIRESWWNSRTLFYVYFHENQIAYPLSSKTNDNRQFALINFNSALSADRIAFNSLYNQNSFLDGCKNYLRKFSEINGDEVMGLISEKSTVLYPGMSFALIDRLRQERTVHSPVIVWNHRWEHDKGVQRFLETLNALLGQGLEFQVILLGQMHPDFMPYIGQIRKILAQRLIHLGFASSYQTYASLLSRSDIVVSSAEHEFFGISVMEAIRAGCVPVLPDKLPYRELYPEKFRYQEGRFGEMLTRRITERKRLSISEANELTDRFSWKSQKFRYRNWLEL